MRKIALPGMEYVAHAKIRRLFRSSIQGPSMCMKTPNKLSTSSRAPDRRAVAVAVTDSDAYCGVEV